jgi:hypothetical protein
MFSSKNRSKYLVIFPVQRVKNKNAQESFKTLKSGRNCFQSKIGQNTKSFFPFIEAKTKLLRNIKQTNGNRPLDGTTTG